MLSTSPDAAVDDDSVGLKTPTGLRLPRLPKSKEKDFHTPPGLPELHSLTCLFAHRGGGKSYFINRLVKAYGKALTHVFVVSPTLKSQTHLFQDYLGVPPEHLFQVDSVMDVKNALAQILQQIGGEYKNHKDTKAYAAAYHKLLHNKRLSPDEANMLQSKDAMPPDPIHPRPVPYLIADDLQSMGNVLRSPWWESLCVRHRHVADGCGLSIAHLNQSLRSMSRAVRQNASFIGLWGTHDKSALEDLAKECANHVPRDKFMDMFRKATEEPHSFLGIDLSGKPKGQVFSRNLETYFDA